MTPEERRAFHTQRLADYVQTMPGDYEQQCAAEALAMVDQHIAGAPVPTESYNRAVLEVAAELWNRRGAPNGIKSFGDMEAPATFRIARDPMVAARPILAPYLPLVIS